MNWIGAIDVNRVALLRIIAVIVVLLERHGGAAWIPLAAHRAIVRILRPAESAVRRLILIAAYKAVTLPVSEKIRPSRPWPKGLVIARKTDNKRRTPFRLFDPIRQFVDFPEHAPVSSLGSKPRIGVVDHDPRIPEFLRAPSGPPPQPGVPEGFISTRNISTRLTAVRFALSDLQRQAKRLLRNMRKTKPGPRRLILRPGPPPGGRKKPRQDVDQILTECHALARAVLSENSS